MWNKTHHERRVARLTLMLLLLFTPVSSFAMELPQQRPVPGGITFVSLGMQKPAKALYQGKPTLLLETAQGWLSIVGIPLDAKPGKDSLEVRYLNNQVARIGFSIQEKEYASQHITLQNKRQVNPEKQDLERIHRETKQIRAALSDWSPDTPNNFVWSLPVAGPLSSPFGLKRFFNEQPRKPHSGLDIVGAKGTAILAPAKGIVIDTGDYFFNGKTLFIQHGQGLVTMYCHMDSIFVQKGQRISPGDRIGTVGSSGRATGPHLHWGVSLNDTMVDPTLFLSPAGDQEKSNETAP